jgi:hypothetical protein
MNTYEGGHYVEVEEVVNLLQEIQYADDDEREILLSRYLEELS